MNWLTALSYWSIGISIVLILSVFLFLGFTFPTVGIVEIVILLGGLIGFGIYNSTH